MKTPQEYEKYYNDITNNWKQLDLTFTGRAMPQPRLNARSKFAGYYNPGLQRKASNYKAYSREITNQFVEQMLLQHGKMFKIPDNSPIIASMDFYLIPARGGGGDLDNYIKAILDILRNTGLFKNDVKVISLQDCNKITVKFTENQRSRVKLYWQDIIG